MKVVDYCKKVNYGDESSRFAAFLVLSVSVRWDLEDSEYLFKVSLVSDILITEVVN